MITDWTEFSFVHYFAVLKPCWLSHFRKFKFTQFLNLAHKRFCKVASSTLNFYFRVFFGWWWFISSTRSLITRIISLIQWILIIRISLFHFHIFIQKSTWIHTSLYEFFLFLPGTFNCIFDHFTRNWYLLITTVWIQKIIWNSRFDRPALLSIISVLLRLARPWTSVSTGN